MIRAIVLEGSLHLLRGLWSTHSFSAVKKKMKPCNRITITLLPYRDST